jgi:type I restriction-modification system DNA methylase subunit
MHWIAPSEKDASSRCGSRAFHTENLLYLAPEACVNYLLTLPDGADFGAKANAAMREVEKHNPQLAGVLPKTYNLFTSTLPKELLKKISVIPATLDFDAFGRIYEYFLGEFAMSEGQGGGEFYTPASIVKLLTQVIEPFHGRILDPACGSGGMFVQSASFVAEHHQNPAAELAICGVEKTDETGRLARLNLAVHGLECDIRHGGNVNSYFDDPHKAASHGGQFDLVFAKPPFNVNTVDKERLKDMVGVGLPNGSISSNQSDYCCASCASTIPRAKPLFLQRQLAFRCDSIGADLVKTALNESISHQSKAIPQIQNEEKGNIFALTDQLFYRGQIPVCLWFLAIINQPRANVYSATAAKRCRSVSTDQHQAISVRIDRDETDLEIFESKATSHTYGRVKL